MTDHDENCEICQHGSDDFLSKMEENIRRYGLSIVVTGILTAAGEVAMAYTVGLADAGKPDLVVFGLPYESAVPILNNAARRLRDNALPLDEPITGLANFPLVFKSVEAAAASEYLLCANRRAGRDLPAIQMVWPDPSGRFPWEPGYAQRFKEVQLELYPATH